MEVVKIYLCGGPRVRTRAAWSIAAAVLALPGNLSAQDGPERWHVVGGVVGGEAVFAVDTESLIRRGGSVTAWVRIRFPAREMQNQVVDEILMRNRYDCENRLIHDGILYARRNERNVSTDENLGARPFAPIPDSINEMTLAFICDYPSLTRR